MFGHNAELWSCNAQYCVWQKANTAHQHNHFIQAVKHSGDMMMMMMITGLSPCSHWIDHELLALQKYFRVRCEAVCLRAKATLNLGDETGRWSQASKKISNRMAKKKRKEWSICNGQTSCTTMWETDKVIKKRWFCKLLNHCVYVVFHRNASLFWLGFC